jgi:hypothetical protein
MTYYTNGTGDSILSGTVKIGGYSGGYLQPFQPVLTIGKETIVSLNTINNKKEEQKYMEYVYEVIVVDKYREILLDEKVVAKNEEKAKFNAGVYKHLDANGLTLDDVTVLTRALGQVEVDKELV